MGVVVSAAYIGIIFTMAQLHFLRAGALGVIIMAYTYSSIT